MKRLHYCFVMRDTVSYACIDHCCQKRTWNASQLCYNNNTGMVSDLFTVNLALSLQGHSPVLIQEMPTALQQEWTKDVMTQKRQADSAKLCCTRGLVCSTSRALRFSSSSSCLDALLRVHFKVEYSSLSHFRPLINLTFHRSIEKECW